ncbi:sugar ABC transporter substrate-binding protein [Leucobacter sp. Z1108]|uniref:sugar ABC transporter substrate-binding protein n=1 Tax=Leucobacter sp. Z1108 TaxID=3439066 RepID=UPI003F3B843D
MHITRMRRLTLSTAVVGVAALALTACGSGTTEDSGTTTSTSATAIDVGIGEVVPQNTDNIAIMIQAGPTFSDSAAKAEGAQAAAEDLGVNVEVYWSDLDPATELSNYNSIVTSGKFGAVGIQSVSPQMCKTVSDTVIDAQLLVAAFGGPLCGTGAEMGPDLVAPGTIAYVDQNNLIEGAMTMFNGAVEKLGDGPQKVLFAYGNQGHTTVTAHETAWAEFSKDHPEWEVIGNVYTDWTTPGAYADTQNLLQANPDATVVFSVYVDITGGVVKAISDQGLGDKISVFESSGGSELSAELLESGQILGTVPVFSYDVGYAAVEAIVNTAKEGTPAGYVLLPRFAEVGMVTRDTIDDLGL